VTRAIAGAEEALAQRDASTRTPDGEREWFPGAASDMVRQTPEGQRLTDEQFALFIDGSVAGSWFGFVLAYRLFGVGRCPMTSHRRVSASRWSE
jgi:hypothetical protein